MTRIKFNVMYSMTIQIQNAGSFNHLFTKKKTVQFFTTSKKKISKTHMTDPIKKSSKADFENLYTIKILRHFKD